MTKRVVITGMGLVSSLGNDLKSAFDRLHIYENCVKYDTSLEQYKNLNTKLSAPIVDFKESDIFTRKVKRTMGRVAIFAVTGAIDAIDDAGLTNDPILENGETGVSFGSSSGSIDSIIDFFSMTVNKELKALNSGSYVKMMPQTTAANLSLFFKTKGRLITSSTACTSGSMGIGLAYEAIKEGKQKIMIAGGAEEFHPTQVGIFDTLYATSAKNDTPKLSPRAFDSDRDGLVIGEGAGVMILEEYEHAISRGAKIYAEIAGFSTNTDGTHITNPNSETMAIVMKQSLKDANLEPSQIGYINAHGTGTIQGDSAESNATYEVFKNHCPISTIKSYTGHTLGAAGAIEAILSVDMMNKKWFCPNLNLKNVASDCAELDYIIDEGRIIDTQYIMSNNFAFGGINTSLIFKKW